MSSINTTDTNRYQRLPIRKPSFENSVTAGSAKPGVAEEVSAQVTSEPVPPETLLQKKRSELSVHLSVDESGTLSASFKHSEKTENGASTRTRGSLDVATVLKVIKQLKQGNRNSSAWNNAIDEMIPE